MKNNIHQIGKFDCAILKRRCFEKCGSC